MEGLTILGTAITPLISFNALTGVMEIQGRSIPENADDFWFPILNWFESYLIKPAIKTTFKINLEYFDISSSKRILFLLNKLTEISENGFDVCVEWIYKKENEEMYEVGKDFDFMVKAPFKFQQSDIIKA